jgi:hypothetical protein
MTHDIHPIPPPPPSSDAEYALILADMIEHGRNDCGYVHLQVNAGSYRTQLVAALRRLAAGSELTGAGETRESIEQFAAGSFAALRAQCWTQAWSSVAGAFNCQEAGAATRWADKFLADFDQRFADSAKAGAA